MCVCKSCLVSLVERRGPGGCFVANRLVTVEPAPAKPKTLSIDAFVASRVFVSMCAVRLCACCAYGSAPGGDAEARQVLVQVRVGDVIAVRGEGVVPRTGGSEINACGR